MVVALTTAFFLVMISIVAGLSYWVWSRETAVAGVATAPASGPAAGSETSQIELPQGFQYLADIGNKVSVSEDDRASVRRDLVSAGIRDDWAVPVVFGARVAAAILVPIALTVVFFGLGSDMASLAPALLIAAYLSFRLPDRYLSRRMNQRQHKIQRGLPDLLDLLVISVDSGLSLENALADTARDLSLAHPVISDELSVFQNEVRAGASRAEALRNLGRRTREPEMRKLTSLLIQADRFGTSIVKVLRTQARYMRTRRRQRAEELAHKVGVKMIFPIFFLIMPSIFLVTAGPAVIQLMTKFRGIASGF